jgi:hypothetical protein
MRNLNYWIDLMTRWGVSWIAGSENKAHSKIASLFAQPYISLPDYDTVEFPSKMDILLVRQSAVNEYKRCPQSNAMACQEVQPQQFDAGGMRMMNNAPWIPVPERAVELQLCLCVEEYCLSAGQSVRSDAWRNQGVCGMDNDCQGCQGRCAELFALCRDYSWRQRATTAGYAATCDQAQRDSTLRLDVHRVVKRREVSVLATSQG